MREYTIQKMPKQEAWRLAKRDWGKRNFIVLAYFGDRKMASRVVSRLNRTQGPRPS